MPDNPNAPFGDNTIEGAFLNDMGVAFERDDTDVSVVVETMDGVVSDPVDIPVCNIDILQGPAGTTDVHGTSHEVVEIVYELTVPVELAVAVGDIVVVSGFEADWSFEPIDGVQVSDEQTTVIARDIRRSYGDTSEPDFEENK